MAKLKWTSKRPTRQGFYWLAALCRRSGALVRPPVVVEITAMDFNPKYVSQLCDAYYGPGANAARRFWIGPLPVPKINAKRLWQNG